MGYKLLGCFWQFSLELLWSVILKLKSNPSLVISCFVCTKVKQSLQLPWRKATAVHRITFARVWVAATEKKILRHSSKKKVTPLQGHRFGGYAQKSYGTRIGTYHTFPSIEGTTLGLCSMSVAKPRKEPLGPIFFLWFLNTIGFSLFLVPPAMHLQAQRAHCLSPRC